jgi:hypothetical protein
MKTAKPTNPAPAESVGCRNRQEQPALELPDTIMLPQHRDAEQSSCVETVWKSQTRLELTPPEG